MPTKPRKSSELLKGASGLLLELRLQSPYTGVSTRLSHEIPKKSQKGVPEPPGPECQKSVEKSPNTDFVVLLTLFQVIRGTFSTERSSREVAEEFLRKFREILDSPGTFQKLWEVRFPPSDKPQLSPSMV